MEAFVAVAGAEEMDDDAAGAVKESAAAREEAEEDEAAGTGTSPLAGSVVDAAVDVTPTITLLASVALSADC